MTGPASLWRSASVALSLLFCTSGAFASEHRCGWYENPTPGNLSLRDKDAEWNITSQGEAAGPDAEGAERNAPAIDYRQFVRTRASYGYGCACLMVETSTKDKRITKVISGKILPLETCKADHQLPKPS